MMFTPKTCREELTSLAIGLIERGAALDFNTIVEQRRGGIISVGPAGFEALPYRDFGDIEEYLDIIKRRQFAFLLTDGSAVQATYSFNEHGVLRHRLCFHPCPVMLSQAEVDLIGEDLGLNEIVELCLGQSEWRSRVRLRSPLRFDFDSESRALGHPSSHLHVSHSACRIPVFGPMSIGHFIRVVFRHFQPNLWESDLRIREWKLTQLGRSIQPSDENELFVECRIGGDAA